MKVKNNLNGQIQTVLRKVNDRKILQEVGRIIVERIRERTRGGRGAKKFGGNASKLKPLSDKYIQQRSRDPRLSSETTPSTSNLTQYGSMLDSLIFTVQNGVLNVSIKGAENIRKAIFTSKDRPWVNLTRADITIIRKTIEKLLRET